jgi:hypothetical protein
MMTRFYSSKAQQGFSKSRNLPDDDDGEEKR